MENILTYLDWRKDITFDVQPFHEVDALIFSELSYVEWDGIVNDKPISLQQACKIYMEHHTKEELERIYVYSVRIPTLVQKLQDATRYKDVYLIHYESQFSVDDEIQFAAITFQLPNHHLFVSFRGTDRSMVGWKEDLKMTYRDVIPSQQLACDYFERVFKDSTQDKMLFGFIKQVNYPKIYLGGHSKGGNLAMCAGICVSEMQKHVEHIFNFDGPGFRTSFYEKYDVRPILDRITTYLPKSSIIGRLLVHKEKNFIMDGCESGLAQHDCFNWCVNRNGFIQCDHLTKESDDTKAFIDDKLMSLDEDKKQEFVEMLFDVLKVLDINSVNDISELSFKQGVTGIKELSAMGPQDRKLFVDIMRFLWDQTKSILFVKKDNLK